MNKGKANAIAQSTAERLRDAVQAEYTITIAVLGLAGSPEDAIVVGACVPGAKFAASLLRTVAESIEQETATITKKGAH